MAKKWFYRGREGFDKAKQVDAEQKARAERSGPMRWWLEKNDKGRLIWLDTPQFFVWEHNLEISGKFFNFFTCIKEEDTCPFCETEDRSSYNLVGSVLSLKPYTDRDGESHKIQKMLFCAKSKARDALVRQIERKKGDLTFWAYELARGSGRTECSTGEDFEALSKLSKEKIVSVVSKSKEMSVEEWLTPFDYEKLFAPLPLKEMYNIAGIPMPVGAGEYSEEEDIFTENGGDSNKKDEDDISIDDLIDGI